jgi:hypothetical protein
MRLTDAARFALISIVLDFLTSPTVPAGTIRGLSRSLLDCGSADNAFNNLMECPGVNGATGGA